MAASSFMNCIKSSCLKLTSFLKFMSTGKHNSGFFYKGKTGQSSWCGGCLTLTALLLITILSIQIIVSIANEEEVVYIEKSDQLRFADYNLTIGKAFKELEMYLLMSYKLFDPTLKCENVTVFPYVPDQLFPIEINYTCEYIYDEYLNGSYLQISFQLPECLSSDFYCLKDQAVVEELTITLALNVTYQDIDLRQLYLQYFQKYSYFDNKDIQSAQFQSIGLLPSSYYIKMNPLLYQRSHNYLSLDPEYSEDLYFYCNDPQYVSELRDPVYNSLYVLSVILNDRNLWKYITVHPLNIFYGIAKIGGYFSFFSILRIANGFYHSKMHERNLKKKFSDQLETYSKILAKQIKTEQKKKKSKRSRKSKSQKSVKDLFSYETFFQMIKIANESLDQQLTKTNNINRTQQQNKSDDLLICSNDLDITDEEGGDIEQQDASNSNQIKQDLLQQYKYE